MMRLRWLVVAASVVAAVAGTALYVNRRPETPVRQVPPGSSAVAAEPAPWSAIAPPVAPAHGAPAVSAAESSALFVKTQVCRDIPVRLAALRKNGNCGPALPDAESQADLAACLAQGPSAGDEIRKLEDQQRTCSGYDVTAAGVFAATRAAAEQGDVRAQHCFVGGMFADQRQDKVGLPQADADAYPALASKYIEAGLARGDWSTVFILSQPTRLTSLLGVNHYGIGTPETEYKMTKLLQLGANGKLAERLGHNLDNFTQETATPLTPEAVAAGDQWAQDEYASHFSGSMRLDAMPSDGCTLPGESMP